MFLQAMLTRAANQAGISTRIWGGMPSAVPPWANASVRGWLRRGRRKQDLSALRERPGVVGDQPSLDTFIDVPLDRRKHTTRSELGNLVLGHGHTEHGWSSLDARSALAARPVEILAEHRPALLTRPRKQYRHGMSEPEMWTITRRAWKLRKRDYKYAFCVHDGIIRGVWEINGWETTSNWAPGGRRGFEGEPARDLWQHYVGGLVARYLPAKGGQIPFTVLL